MDESYFIWAKNIIGREFEAKQQRSRDGNRVFMLHWIGGSAFLKVCPYLLQEKQRLEWAEGKINAPKVLGFKKGVTKDYLLISTIEGLDLSRLAKNWNGDDVTSKLVEALKILHEVDISDWPFADVSEGDVLLHGDVALPNLIYDNEGNFNGYIDLGDLKVGDRRRDLIDAVWTLNRNLGGGYGELFLKLYGVEGANSQMAEEYLSLY